MSDKIRVVHHSKSVGYSGTDRTAQLFCKYLAQSKKYEPFLVYRAQDNNERLDIMRGILGEEHVVSYDWFPGKKGRQSPFLPEKDNLHEVLTAIDPQIVHLHRSGYIEWPGFKYLYPKAKWVETNIFGYNDNSPERQMDANVYISQWIRNLAVKAGNEDGPVIFNPIEEPYFEMTPENKQLCRQRLLDMWSIGDDNAVLLGRVGRADNFDGIALRAFKLIYNEFPQAYYLVVNGCPRWREEAERLGVHDRIRFIDPIIGDEELSNFYRGLDIYAHARNDGECCPCNIQEAMMHNIPIVSHESPTHNGQCEIVGDGGFVVPYGDHFNYAEVLKTLISNSSEVYDEERDIVKLVRDHFGRAARVRAMKSFEASCITASMMRVYDWMMENV